MEGDNAPAKKTRGKDIVKRKRIGWSHEKRLSHQRWKERKVEDNRARVNSLVPGSPEFLSEEAKQKGREKAAEKKRKQRMRRRSESMESSYSPTQRLLTLPDGSVILNPMPAPLAMATGMYPDYQAIYTTPTSSVSSTSTPISTMTATPSSSTPRLVVEMQATPSASSSSSPGSAVATSTSMKEELVRERRGNMQSMYLCQRWSTATPYTRTRLKRSSHMLARRSPKWRTQAELRKGKRKNM